MKMYHRYFDSVKQYVLRADGFFMNNAEDIAQDIFLKLWQKRDRLREIDSPKAYLFRMVMNQLITERTKAMKQLKFIENLQAITSGHCRGTEEEIDYVDTCRLIYQGIRALPPQQKIVYQLIKEQGLSREQAAKHLGLSPETVKVHLNLALKKIRISQSVVKHHLQMAKRKIGSLNHNYP